MSGIVDGKVAMVTGGGSGIGRATCLKFAAEGAKVVVSDINVAGGEETVAMIEKDGGEAAFIECNVADHDSVEALVKGVVDRFGRLDCAFNNAGVAGDQVRTKDSTFEDFNKIIDVNLRGVWYCLKYELEQMLSQGSGAIVSTASVAGLVGFQGGCGYVAAKHGVVGLTKTAALDYAKSGVRVNAVCPGIIETPMVSGVFQESPKFKEMIIKAEPIGRMGQPTEIAAATVWLCSDKASFVTGHAMPVDGGYIAQ